MVSPNPGLLAALLKTGRLEGVLRWKVNLTKEVLQSEGEMAQKRAYFLDTQSVKNLDDFFKVLTKQLDLPKVDLANFETSLTGLAKDQEGVLLGWSGWQDLVKNSPDDAKSVIAVFEALAESWPGVILVIDPQGKFPDLAELMSA